MVFNEIKKDLTVWFGVTQKTVGILNSIYMNINELNDDLLVALTQTIHILDAHNNIKTLLLYQTSDGI